MRRLLLPILPPVLAPLFCGAAAGAWEWDGQAWADYRAFLGPVPPAMQARLQDIVATGQAAGRIEGRLGQIGDSITESSAYFRNAVLQGVTSNGTGHDYVPIRSWLAYSGAQPPDAFSFYRDHGKGIAYGNRGGWRVPQALDAGHPERGVVEGDGATPGQYSWVLVMFGTNDIDATDFDAVAWKETYRPLVQGYAQLGVVPVLSTIPPCQPHVADGRVDDANAAIRALAAEELIPWVDFHGLVLRHQPVDWVGTLIGNDGIHPTANTDGRGFSQSAQTTSDGYALRTKLTFDLSEKLRAIVWNDGPPDAPTEAPPWDGVPAPAPPHVAPNPFGAATEITCPRGGRLAILDVSGRLVRTLRATPSVPVRWDGTDDHGHDVVDGVYFVRPPHAGGAGDGGSTGTIVRLR